MVDASLAECSGYLEAILRVLKQYRPPVNILEVVRRFYDLILGCYSSRWLLSVSAYTLPSHMPVCGIYLVYNILLCV